MNTTGPMLKVLAMLTNYPQGSDEYEVAAFALRKMITPTQLEQLNQLVNSGPCWDGDVISKAARDDLLEMGLASRACVKGGQGYTVANYRGWDVLKTFNFWGGDDK